jgi:hypothetical protein
MKRAVYGWLGAQRSIPLGPTTAMGSMASSKVRQARNEEEEHDRDGARDVAPAGSQGATEMTWPNAATRGWLPSMAYAVVQGRYATLHVNAGELANVVARCWCAGRP